MPSAAARIAVPSAHQHHPQAGLEGVGRCLPPQLQVGQEQDGRCGPPRLHHSLQEGLLSTPAQRAGSGLHGCSCSVWAVMWVFLGEARCLPACTRCAFLSGDMQGALLLDTAPARSTRHGQARRSGVWNGITAQLSGIRSWVCRHV